MTHNQYAAPLVYPTEVASDEDNGDEQQQRSQGERGELENTGTNSRQVLVVESQPTEQRKYQHEAGIIYQLPSRPGQLQIPRFARDDNPS